jgi:hypothetical protein
MIYRTFAAKIVIFSESQYKKYGFSYFLFYLYYNIKEVWLKSHFLVGDHSCTTSSLLPDTIVYLTSH